MQCSARSKRTGEQCKRSVAPGRTVCSMHGGKSPQGIAASNFQHGRYSKVLPTRLAARYQEAQTDSELLTMRDEIALLDARLSDVLSRVDHGESGALWDELLACVEAFDQARASADLGEAGQSISRMTELIRKGHADYESWADVRVLVEQRRKLVESERKRLVDQQQMITVERAMAMIATFTESIRRNVHDRSVLAAISADLGALLDRPVQELPGRTGRGAGDRGAAL